MSFDAPDHNLDSTIARLYSNDANDRVKAAGELGEIGTPEVAPKLLEVTYEDEASTVRQMAIQSYSEILGEQSLNEVIKVADSHFDEYVRLYAIMILGRIGGPQVIDPLRRYLALEDEKAKAAALRAMIHAETRENGDAVFDLLKKSKAPLIIRNCIEALSLWKYGDAKDYIRSKIFEREDLSDLELKTISAFYLAVMNDKSGRQYLQDEKIDNYIRIAVNDTHYHGRDGLLEAVSKL